MKETGPSLPKFVVLPVPKHLSFPQIFTKKNLFTNLTSFPPWAKPEKQAVKTCKKVKRREAYGSSGFEERKKLNKDDAGLIEAFPLNFKNFF